MLYPTPALLQLGQRVRKRAGWSEGVENACSEMRAHEPSERSQKADRPNGFRASLRTTFGELTLLCFSCPETVFARILLF